jgi:hypothetical protein
MQPRIESELVNIVLQVSQPTFFFTSEDNKLCFTPGSVRFSFVLGFEQRSPAFSLDQVSEEFSSPQEHWDVGYCRTCVLDADGNLWAAKSLFTPDTLLENLEDWRRGSWAHLFEQTTAEWKVAFETRSLLQGMRGFFDDRCSRRIILDDSNQVYEIPFKHQYPSFDIAFLKLPHQPINFTAENRIFDRSKLLVRVSGFQTREGTEVPAFVYEIDCATLMFYAQTHGLPTPLIFTKVGSVEQRQPLVQYVSKN